jgi:hypothetical protein
MNRTLQNFKVGNIVIQLVAILVVNNLVFAEPSAEMQFHNVPVLVNPAAINLDFTVSVADEKFSFTISEFFSGKGITVTHKALMVHTAQAATADTAVAAIYCADIGLVVFYESSGHIVFNHSAHWLPSIDTCNVYGNSIQLIVMGVNRDDGANRVNSGELPPGGAEDNPEPSQKYTSGRCNDYRRGLVPLITGLSARLERDDIVYSS